MDRRSALVTHERSHWGGSYYDSFTHAAMFRQYKPFEFGVKGAQLFSAKIGEDMINKKFTYYTVAQKQVHMLPGGVDEYTWYLMGSTANEYRFTELLVASDATPGKGGVRFKVALDRDYLHEPVYLKLGQADLPLLRIIGQGTSRSVNSTEYEVELQTGDLNAWIPLKYLQPGATCIQSTSFTADELNTKYGPDEYGEMFKLFNWTTQYSRKAEFTDKFIRTEIACRKEGRPMSGNDSYSIAGAKQKGTAVSSGYVYQTNLQDKTTKVISKGTFITNIEARLEERVMWDREMAMEDGQLQKTVDYDTNRPIKIPAGWRQLVKDGHYLEHNGSLSLGDIFSFFQNIFLTRKDFSDRKIKIASGEAGIQFLSRKIFEEYSSIVTVDTLFAKPNTTPEGYHTNELEYGAQFTKIKMMNGIEVSIVHDPTKDDRSRFPELAPGTNYTLESYTMDIFDLGNTNQTPQGMDGQNMCMVMQDGVEEYYTVSNIYNFETGAITDGGNAYSNNKELGIYRTIAGSLNVWDVSRVAQIRLNLNL